VCLFIPHLGIGGAELQLILLASRLQQEGFRPLVATVELLRDVASPLREAGIPVQVLPRRGRVGLDTLGALRQLVIQERVDILHSWLWASNWRTALTRFVGTRVPKVLSIRSMEQDLTLGHQATYRLLSPLYDVITVNSEAVMRRSMQRTGLKRAKYRVIYNGIDSDRFERESTSGPRIGALDGLPVVGFVGGIHPRKRPETLPRVASEILQTLPDAVFLVVGDGPARGSVERECRRIGADRQFLFMGYQSQVASLMRQMTVLIHPSRNEGCCNALLEAQSLGVPVVAYDVGGNRETVLDGRTGFLVPDGDEKALASKVVTLLRERRLRQEMGSRARYFVRDRFSVSGMVRRTAEVYRESLEKRSRRPAGS
jgi:glycosyltransferase involved in cell wall biosynthesis